MTAAKEADKGYQSLAAGVIEFAIYEYEREFMKMNDETECEYDRYKSSQKVKELEKFFRSDWCSLLMGKINIDGDVIIQEAQKRAEVPDYVPKKWFNV